MSVEGFIEHELEVPCPMCGKPAKLRTLIRKIPYYGEIRIVSFKCDHCGYRRADVQVLKQDQPKVIKRKVKEPKDLEAMLVLTSQASIRIPELGITITPGPKSQGRMLPVSALLLQLIDMTRFAMKNAIGDKRESERITRGLDVIDRLKSELEHPTGRLTIVIEDPTGRGDVIPEEIRSKRAEEERK